MIMTNYALSNELLNANVRHLTNVIPLLRIVIVERRRERPRVRWGSEATAAPSVEGAGP